MTPCSPLPELPLLAWQAPARKLALALLAAASLGLGALPARAGPPDEPAVAEIRGEIGRPGGTLHTLIGRARDTRLLVVYGYARLVGYDRDLALVPDILREVEVEDGRVFTMHLRKGHRWSDGHPFTAEDFRYWWEDVALNEELSSFGPPHLMLVEDQPPVFEVLDEHTVRYSWSVPNPFFLPAQAAATPLFTYMPAHYLKPFHAAHADPAELARLVEADRARDWVQLHKRRDGMYDSENPDLPTLQPWVITTRAPAERFVAVRNRHYHRVDPSGQQLPYLDRVVLEVVDGRLVPIKTGAGETDLQARGLSFKDYTFLKENEGRGGLRIHLWETARSAHLALYPNLNAADPVFRDLFRDARFRRALSLATDRQSINQFLFHGLARGVNNTVLPLSPLYTDEIGQAFVDYDPAAAGALLDELGLDRRGPRGVRLLPDGRPLEWVIESAGEETEQSDVLELVRDQWAEIGIRVHTKPSQREVLRNRVFSGEALMTIWFGRENGIPTAEMSPEEFVPVSQQHYQWPMWGQHHETRGVAGEPPDLPEATRLMELFEEWRLAKTTAEREAIWREILAINAEEVYSIGLIGAVLQPVAVRERLRNVPEQAVWNWEPGAQFGLYRPDTFWLAD